MGSLTFAFDTETTGLPLPSIVSAKRQPHVIEFYGALVTDEGEIVEEIEFLCDPKVPITEEITKITGIRPEDVAGKPQFKEHIPAISELLKKAEMVMAHNLSFDMFMVDKEYERIGAVVTWPPLRLCTVEATEWICSHRLSLSALHQHLFDEPFTGAHRAGVDVAAMIRCFVALRKRGDV